MKIERADVYPLPVPLNLPCKDANRIETHSPGAVVKPTESGGAAGRSAR